MNTGEFKTIHGMIKQDGHQILFTSDGFKFCFYQLERGTLSTDDMRLYNKTLVKLIPNDDGYVFGITSDRKGIAIYIKNEIIIYDSREVNTWNYIITKGVLDVEIIDETALQFNSIRFTNGSLRSVVPCAALKEDNDSEKLLEINDAGVPLVYRMKNDSVTFATYCDDEKELWTFGSSVNKNYSVYSGYQLSNSLAVARIDFDENHTLGTFYDYYGYISTLVSFLMFRKNICFETIELLRGQPDHDLVTVAECYVKTNVDIKKMKLFNVPEREGGSLRNFVEVLSVPMLSEDSFRTIMECIVMKDAKHVDVPTLIIPIDESDAFLFSADKIRSMCTALEVEMDASHICAEPEDNLLTLVDIVKEQVKEHRNGKDRLLDKTYDIIFQSISHWGASLADRLIKAWHENRVYFEKWLVYRGISITDDDLKELIKARNNYTHKGFSEVNENLANTTYVVRGLIYVLALKRMRIKDDYIRELISRGFLG